MRRFAFVTRSLPAAAFLALLAPASLLAQPASRIQSYRPYATHSQAPLTEPASAAAPLSHGDYVPRTMPRGGMAPPNVMPSANTMPALTPPQSAPVASEPPRAAPWQMFQTPSYGPPRSDVLQTSFQQPLVQAAPASTATETIQPPLADGAVEPFLPYGAPGATPGDDCCIECETNACPWSTAVFAGVQGFKGPANRGQDGSFGVHEGINWGTCVWCSDLSVQFGLQGVHSNLSGARDTLTTPDNLFTTEERDQLFVTFGLFRRVDHGFQGGLVYDYMNDSWDYGLNLGQIRTQLSWRHCCGAEFGYYGAVNVDSDRDVVAANDLWITTEWHSLFFRYELEAGGYGMVYAGTSNKSEGLLGAEYLLPVSCSWALGADMTYLSPELADDNRQEAWNLALNVVWQPGGFGCGNYGRPLFNVANNGSMLFDRVR